MTEQELIELVNQKTPDELSVEEMEQIREGISSSHMLREALAESLKVETGLNESLGKIEVSVDKILLAAGAAGAGAMLAAPAPLAPVILNWGVGSAIVAVLSSVLVVAVVAPPPPADKVDPTKNVIVEPEKAPPFDPDSIPGPSIGDPVHPVDTSKDPNDPTKADEKTDPADKEAGKKEARKGKNNPIQLAAGDPSAANKVSGEAAALRNISASARAADEAWEQAAPKRSFAETALDDFTSTSGTDFGGGNTGGKNPDKMLLELFSPFPGKDGRVSTQADGNRFYWGVMENWLKFQPKWRKNAVLKLALFQENGVRLHFWNGKEGVSLFYYPHVLSWAAYGTTRKGTEPEPATLALWDADDDRYRRTAIGSVEIRHQDGQLIVSRGDTLLLSAPMKEPPAEIYSEGRAVVRGISFFHGASFPTEPENPLPLVWRSATPARMQASKDIPAGAQLKLNDDGSVDLSSAKTQTQAWIAWPVPESGLTEIVFQVEGTKPGAGVFLGDAQGKPLYQVGFLRESNTKNLTVGWLHPTERRLDAWHEIRERVVPWAASTPGAKQWIRIVVGHGTAKLWTSGDGLHWGRAVEPFRGDLKGSYAQAGIYCQAGDGPYAIKLRLIEIRRLDALASLASAELRSKAPALGIFNSPSEWLREVLASCPPGVPSADWQKACAVRTLAGGAPPALARGILLGLLSEGMKANLPVAKRLQMLDEAMLLADTWEPAQGLIYARLYEQLGQILVREGDLRPYTQVGRALIESPLWVQGDLPTMPESLVRAEVLGGTYAGRAADVYDVCHRIRFWSHSRPYAGPPPGREESLKLAEWAGAWALAHWTDKLKERPAVESALPTNFRHPLVEQLSKEGFNILAEFEAALAGDSFQDACQIITSSSTLGALGLLPDGKDPQLLVSLPNAVALAMRESPGLKRTMQDQFGKVGMLRVKQAMSEGSTLDVQAATVQFYGTDAAAEAHLWLGDRALAAGDFPHAIGHYQHLLTSGIGIAGRQSQIAARVRLAGALLGRDVGQPLTESIDLAGTTLTPTDFEAMVTDLRASRALPGSAGAAAVAGESSAQGQGLAPLPARFETKSWGRFAGMQGSGTPHMRSGDWAGQQLATVVASHYIYASNRYEVTCIDLNNGQAKWSRNVGNPGNVTDAPGMAMTPVLVGDRLLLRWIGKSGPEIVALDRKNGNTLWTGRNLGTVLCDPIVVQDQIHLLTAGDPQNKVMQVNFVTLELRNGQLVSQTPLAQFRDAWNRQIPCQAVLVDNRIIATLGGTVLSVDLLGHPQWLRRQTVVPQLQDYRWSEQCQDPPVVSRGQVFATQLGVREITCLDLETGRLRWERAIPQLVRLTGLVDGRLIIRTAAGIEALSAKDGTTLWQSEQPNLLVAQLLPSGKTDDKTGRDILVASSEPADMEQQSRVRLTWIDPATGGETARRPLNDLLHKSPRFGPLVAHENRLFGFFRRGSEPGNEIFELVSEGELPHLSPQEIAAQVALPAGWRRELFPQIREAAIDLFPGWELIEGHDDKQAGYRKEWQGVKDVFVCGAEPGRGVAFARQVTIPAGSKARLALKVGHDTADKWSVDVRVGTTVLSTQKLEIESSQGGWKEWQVDLSPYAGKTVWLIVEQRGNQTGRVISYWKQLEIVN